MVVSGNIGSFLPLLEKLAVTVSVLKRDGVTHRERHQSLVEYEEPLSAKVFELSQRDRLCLSALDNLLDSKRSVLGFPTCDKLFSVIWELERWEFVCGGEGI